jgi:hypothetical protein
LSCNCVPPRTPLGGVGVVKIESQTGQPSKDGGGFEWGQPLKVVAVTEVRVCVDKVQKEVETWIGAQHLSVLKFVPGETSLLFHARRAGDDHGYFEVSYEVDAPHGRAQISFWFIDLAGRQHDPSEFKDLGTASLLEAFASVIKC